VTSKNRALAPLAMEGTGETELLGGGRRRSAVASVLLELCGVIKTFGTSWNGRRDGRRSGSAGVGYCHQTSSGHRPGGPLSARHKAHPRLRSPPARC
jgi:hypothetical protein